MLQSEAIQKALSLIQNGQDQTKILGLDIGAHTNVKPGDYIARHDAQSPPKLSLAFDVPSVSGKYLVIGLDIDAPFPSLNVLGPILHWIQPGLSKGNDGRLEVSEPFVADYIGPAPPPGSSPHRYVFFLYEQPVAFDGSRHAPPNGEKLSNWYRVRCGLDALVEKMELGPILAVNYFRSN